MFNKKIVALLTGGAILLGGFVASAAALQDSTNKTSNEEVIVFDDPKTIVDYDIQKISADSVKKYNDLLNKHKGKKVVIQLDNGKNEEISLTNKEYRKWIIRNSIDNLMAGKNKSEDELLSSSINSMRKRNLTFKFVEENYDVKIVPSDVKKFIDMEVDRVMEDEQMVEFTEKLVAGLNIDYNTFIYDWEYDNFLNNYVWLKVRPQLVEKHPINTGEDQFEYQERLLDVYRTELDNYISSKGKFKKYNLK